jgi:hypothetical protein
VFHRDPAGQALPYEISLVFMFRRLGASSKIQSESKLSHSRELRSKKGIPKSPLDSPLTGGQSL